RSEKPRDQFDIGDDPGLKAFKEGYVLHAFGDTRGKNFAGIIFDQAGVYVPQKWPREDSAWSSATEPFLYWKTEDKPAYTPTFDEARPKVVKAWRERKARDRAGKEADRIKAELLAARKQGDGIRLLRDESAKHPAWGTIFSLSDIARLVPVKETRA